MTTPQPLNLFYGEPEKDRWLPFDRYPRRVIRRLVRGAPKVGGHQQQFLNLVWGLDRLGVPYRVNDYGHADRHPEELVCIAGKHFLLRDRKWRNPTAFGPATFSHPSEDPHIFDELPVRKLLLAGPWMMELFAQSFEASRLAMVPTGIDVDRWAPPAERRRDHVLIYDKIRWEREGEYAGFIERIESSLKQAGKTSVVVRYGAYSREQFRDLLARAEAMVFVCEHETQGIAYQEALAMDVPLFAWDRGGHWRDPEFYPRIKFGPVSSVPYWDERCGLKFADLAEFDSRLGEFLELAGTGSFAPRDYVLDVLSPERCSQHFADVLHQAAAEL